MNLKRINLLLFTLTPKIKHLRNRLELRWFRARYPDAVWSKELEQYLLLLRTFPYVKPDVAKSCVYSLHMPAVNISLVIQHLYYFCQTVQANKVISAPSDINFETVSLERFLQQTTTSNQTDKLLLTLTEQATTTLQHYLRLQDSQAGTDNHNARYLALYLQALTKGLRDFFGYYYE